MHQNVHYLLKSKVFNAEVGESHESVFCAFEITPEPTTTENRLRDQRLFSERKELVQAKTGSQIEKKTDINLYIHIFEDS